MEPIIEKCDQFVEMHVWPIEPQIRVEQWLSNFRKSELEHAKALLDSFYFFNEKMCKKMQKSAVQNLSLLFRNNDGTQQQTYWDEFCRSAIFTYPDGNATASGKQALRNLRKSFSLDESRCLDPCEALYAIKDGRSKYLVFVDDVIGSGLQFTETWTDLYPRMKENSSFANVFNTPAKRAFYIPYIATEYGIDEIHKTCENIEIRPAHILNASYNACCKKSNIWPSHLQHTAMDFLQTTSKRAGFEEGWMGFSKLGLTIAFYNGIPDASLPIFYSNKNNWQPLMESS